MRIADSRWVFRGVCGRWLVKHGREVFRLRGLTYDPTIELSNDTTHVQSYVPQAKQSSRRNYVLATWSPELPWLKTRVQGNLCLTSFGVKMTDMRQRTTGCGKQVG